MSRLCLRSLLTPHLKVRGDVQTPGNGVDLTVYTRGRGGSWTLGAVSEHVPRVEKRAVGEPGITKSGIIGRVRGRKSPL